MNTACTQPPTLVSNECSAVIARIRPIDDRLRRPDRDRREPELEAAPRATLDRREQDPQVGRERDRGRGDRRREPGRQRHPAAHEADRRVIGLAQVDVLAAGARHHRAELGVRRGAAQREHAADDPRQQDRQRIVQAVGLEAGAREHADADHVGDDDRRRDRQAEPSFRRSHGRLDPLGTLKPTSEGRVGVWPVGRSDACADRGTPAHPASSDAPQDPRRARGTHGSRPGNSAPRPGPRAAAARFRAGACRRAADRACRPARRTAAAAARSAAPGGGQRRRPRSRAADPPARSARTAPRDGHGGTTRDASRIMPSSQRGSGRGRRAEKRSGRETSSSAQNGSAARGTTPSLEHLARPRLGAALTRGQRQRGDQVAARRTRPATASRSGSPPSSFDPRSPSRRTRGRCPRSRRGTDASARAGS